MHPAVWRAIHAPSVITFQYKAGDGEQRAMRAILAKCDLLQDRITSEGRHLVIANRKRRYRLLITGPHSAGSGYVIPRDPWFRTRLAAIEAFDALYWGRRIERSSDALMPSAYQKHRLALLLKILTAIHRIGKNVTTREIAQEVLFRQADLGRAIEWKSSSHRRQTQRLINEAHYFVTGGYRLLLKGRMQPRIPVEGIRTE